MIDITARGLASKNAASLAEKMNQADVYLLSRAIYGSGYTDTVFTVANSSRPVGGGGFSQPSDSANYATRDQVVQYLEYNSIATKSYIPSAFDATSVTFTQTPTNVQIGSVLDCLTQDDYTNNTHVNRYTGIATAINGNVVTVSGWYMTGNTAIGQIPPIASIYRVLVDTPTKVWLSNGCIFLQSGSFAKNGVVSEFDLFNGKYSVDSSARIDGLNFSLNSGKGGTGILLSGQPSPSAYGFDAGFWCNAPGTWSAFISDDATNHFLARSNGTTVFKIDTLGNVTSAAITSSGVITSTGFSVGAFNIDSNGEQALRRVKTGTATTTGTTLSFASQLYILSGASNNYICPSPTNFTHQIFKICAINSGITLTIPNYFFGGSPITLTQGKSIELWSDGTNWYTIS